MPSCRRTRSLSFPTIQPRVPRQCIAIRFATRSCTPTSSAPRTARTRGTAATTCAYRLPRSDEAVAECLQKVAAKATELRVSIHMPRIGCGLAGGDWSRIEPLINEYLCDQGLSVTVYDFE